MLPSWLTAAPHEVSAAQSGKLSADQWRTTCMVHLVVTLGRLWGSKAHNDCFYAMFSNFMNLVTAVKLATMRSLMLQLISHFEACFRQYLSGLVKLYEVNFSPNQHLALHIGYYMHQFGPIHTWHSFPFEQWNNVLQNINSNMHFGEIEITLFQCFCEIQMLFICWNNGLLLPILAQNLLPIFQQTFQSDC